MKILNICFLGDANTGKSHIIHAYTKGYDIPFTPSLTIGFELNIKNIENNKIYLWDCGSDIRFQRYFLDFLDNIDLFLITADCENWDSIINIHNYKNQINGKKYHILINKDDKLCNKLYNDKLCNYLEVTISVDNNRSHKY